MPPRGRYLRLSEGHISVVLRKPARMEWLAIKQLVIDSEYQREITNVFEAALLDAISFKSAA